MTPCKSVVQLHQPARAFRCVFAWQCSHEAMLRQVLAKRTWPEARRACAAANTTAEHTTAAHRRSALACVQDLTTSETSITEESVQLMKHHGSYMQDDRDKRSLGQGKFYQFMMRTRQPGGHVSNQLYLTMDDLADQVRRGLWAVGLSSPQLM